MTTETILKVTASARDSGGSVSRQLADEVVAKLRAEAPDARVIDRDVSTGLEFVDAAWVAANFTDDAARTDAQAARLAVSDALIAEIEAADTIVIATPIYNFGAPATLKAWIDLVCRARKTFRYTENGPVGLLSGKRAIIAISSGGTPVGSEIDFATPYLRHVLGFIGVHDVQVVDAGRQNADAAAALASARADIAALRAA